MGDSIAVDRRGMQADVRNRVTVGYGGEAGVSPVYWMLQNELMSAEASIDSFRTTYLAHSYLQ